MKGKIIAIEGGACVGKSTLSERLVKQLELDGYPVVLVSSDDVEFIIDKIRASANAKEPLGVSTTLLLNLTSLSILLEETVNKHLQDGKIVIFDSYFDRLRVHLGIRSGFGLRHFNTMFSKLFRKYKPSLSILLDVDIDTGEKSVNREHILYSEHTREINRLYRMLFSSRMNSRLSTSRIIDANRDVEIVYGDLYREVASYLGRLSNI